jgi:hypothetical protein
VSPPLDTARVIEIHHRRGEVLRLLTRYRESIAEFERMLEVARSTGDRVSEGEALVETSYSQFLTFGSEAIAHCRRLAQEALTIGRRPAASTSWPEASATSAWPPRRTAPWPKAIGSSRSL